MAKKIVKLGKDFYKSKTLWVSATTICGGLATYFGGEQSLESLAVVVIGAVFAYLRTITKEPIA